MINYIYNQIYSLHVLMCREKVTNITKITGWWYN
ncbi:uncharacterized protein METZ01_LOCUS388806, partial [marine metagenome]